MVAGVAAPTNVPLYKGYFPGDAERGERQGYMNKPLAKKWDRKSFTFFNMLVTECLIILIFMLIASSTKTNSAVKPPPARVTR